jgi:hypothetical protein
VAAFVFLALGGFVFFVPFVPIAAVGATPPVAQNVGLKVQAANNATLPLGSIGFCYLGVGAVLYHGFYYPTVALNQTAKRACK